MRYQELIPYSFLTRNEEKDPKIIKIAQKLVILLRGAKEAYQSEWTRIAADHSSHDLYATLDDSPWQSEIYSNPLTEMNGERLEEAAQLIAELLSELEELPKGYPDRIKDAKRQELKRTFAGETSRGVHGSIGVGAALSDPDSRGAVVDLALELETASAA